MTIRALSFVIFFTASGAHATVSRTQAGVTVKPSGEASSYGGQTSASTRSVSRPSLPVDFDAKLTYGQTDGVWSTWADLDLQELSGTSGGAFVSVRPSFPRIDSFHGFAPLKYGYFSVAAEAAAAGELTKDESPLAHGALVTAGVVRGGFHGYSQDTGLSNRLGLILGYGREARWDAAVADWDNAQVKRGILRVYGYETELGHRLRLGRGYESFTSLGYRQTLWLRDTPIAPLAEERSSLVRRERWKAALGLEKRLAFGWFEDSSVTFEASAGPNALPVNFIPLTWEYAHASPFLPDASVLFGGGMRFRGLWSSGHSFIEPCAGYYNGYWGGVLQLKIGAMTASFGSWGLELGSEFHSQPMRVWSGSLGMAL